MKPLRQIRLRTIFLVFCCAAVGMTCATAPPRERDPDLSFLNEYLTQLNLYYALLYAAASAMVVGLVEQIRYLVHVEAPASGDINNVRFAWRFAIVWRTIIAVVLGICLLARILLLRRIIQLPEHDLLVHLIFPDTLTLICAIVVFSDSISRWRHPTNARTSRTWVTVPAFISGVVLALLLLPDSGLITYLVHIATQGIEVAQPARFQRVGVFPNQQAEGYRLFWLSLAAAIDIAFAGATLMLANSPGVKRSYAKAALAAFVCSLFAAATFCAWYYTREFHRISPDMASVGFPGSWIDRLSGIIIAAILISTTTYRAARGNASCISQPSHHDALQGPTALHEHFLFVVLLFGAPVAYFVESLRVDFSGGLPFGWQTQIWSLVGEYLRYSDTYIMLAIVALSARLAWERWRRRAVGPKWELHPLDRRRFVWIWLALALLVLIGLPTLSIYCFTSWLGPWYLYGE